MRQGFFRGTGQRRMFCPTRLKVRGLVLGVVACALIPAGYAGIISTKRYCARVLFERYVLDPIPQSVTEIEVDHDKWRLRYGYVFRFGIDQADVDKIVRSRPFGEAEVAKCDRASIFWLWKASAPDGGFVSLYPFPSKRPSWFAPEAWKNPEAYAFEKQGTNSDMQLLLFNPEVSQAYFIIRSDK